MASLARSGESAGPALDGGRIAAALVDIAVLVAGTLAFATVFGTSGAGLVLVGVGWGLYYYFACESGGGQTLGKKLFKLRVVADDGSPATMNQVGVRTILRLVDGLFAGLVGLGTMIATGERRKRVGDIAAGTKIVRADVPVASEPAPAAAPALAGPPPPPPTATPMRIEPVETPQVTSFSPPEEAESATAVAEPPPAVVEPVAEEPVVEEPVVEEPPAEEPVAEEPVVEATAEEDLVAEEPPAEEPVAEEPNADELKLKIGPLAPVEPELQGAEVEDAPEVRPIAAIEIPDPEPKADEPQAEEEPEADEEPEEPRAEESEKPADPPPAQPMSNIELVMADVIDKHQRAAREDDQNS